VGDDRQLVQQQLSKISAIQLPWTVHPLTASKSTTSFHHQLPSQPPPTMANEVSPDQMQARIQQARREAENLKDRIKRKKDELADGTRK
jgi:hypothetical protein